MFRLLKNRSDSDRGDTAVVKMPAAASSSLFLGGSWEMHMYVVKMRNRAMALPTLRRDAVIVIGFARRRETKLNEMVLGAPVFVLVVGDWCYDT